MQTLIFTDLDGSLLNHGNYRFDGAKESLAAIRTEKIPLIIVSSKTAAEIGMIQKELGIHEPFICENGSAIHFPQDYDKLEILEEYGTREGYNKLVLGASYGELTAFLARYKTPLGIRGFFDMEVEEVARRTGLYHARAALAKARQYTEPFIIQDENNLPALEEAARCAGYSITRGGRFFHLKKAGTDKGIAVTRTTRIFQEASPGPWRTLGLGDSDNDIEMLRSVDIPLVVRKEDGSCLKGFAVCSDSPGSAGWNQLVMGVLHGG